MNEAVSTPLTWRQLTLIILIAGVGSVVLLQFVASAVLIPFQSDLGPTAGLLVLSLLYYSANVVFGFLVGYLWPRRHLRVHVFLGAAVGLAQWFADMAWFLAQASMIGHGVVVLWSAIFFRYGLPAAVIFCSLAIIGDLIRKRQLSLNINIALLTAAISLVTAIFGLIRTVFG